MTQHLFGRRLFLFLLLPAALAAAPASHAAPSASEQKVIDRLIERVARNSAMSFIRNGNAYDGAEAAKHLQSKFEHFKDRIASAEDFIELCATRSEMTGQPYQVKLSGRPARNAGEFMLEELRLVRQMK